MSGHENGDAVAARQLQQRAPEHIARGRVHARCRLVQNQHFGRMQAGGGQLQALADAERQGGGRGVGHVGQVKLLQGVLHGFCAFAAHAVKLGVQHQVLPHAQFFIQRKRLRHIAHAHFHCHAARVHGLPQEFRAAFGGIQKAGQHFHGGGFAAAVAAQKAEDFAFGNGEADMVHGGEAAEAFGEPVRFNGGRRIGVGHERGDFQAARALAFFFGQQADIGFFQRFAAVLRHHFARGGVGEQPPVVHRQQVRELFGFVNIGGGDNHGHAAMFVLQIVHQLPKLAARQRVHAGGGFVQNQQIGAVHQRAAQAQFLLHAARKFPCGTVWKRGESRGFQQPCNARFAFGGGKPEQPRVKVDVFPHGQRGIEVFAQALRHIGNAVRQFAPNAFLRHVAAQHGHAARLDNAHARHQREQRGFAHAVRPNQPDRRAVWDVQRHVVQRADFAVAVG